MKKTHLFVWQWRRRKLHNADKDEMVRVIGGSNCRMDKLELKWWWQRGSKEMRVATNHAEEKRQNFVAIMRCNHCNA